MELNQITLDAIAELIADKVTARLAGKRREADAGGKVQVVDVPAEASEPAKAVKVAAPKPEPVEVIKGVPAEAPEAPVDAQALLIKTVSKKGREAAVALLKQAGGERLSELDDGQRAKFVTMAQILLQE